MEEEVAFRAFVGTTPYRFFATRANNFIFYVFYKDRGMLLVAKMLEDLHLPQASVLKKGNKKTQKERIR